MSVIDEVGEEFEGVGERMEHGGQIPPGFYRVRLNGATEHESKTKGTPAYELTFLVLSGPFAGSEVSDKLWRTDSQFCKDRIKLFAVRLGLLKMSADGKKLIAVEGKSDFMDCLDAEMVLEIVHEPDQQNPAKKWPRFAPNGAHDPNNSKIKEIMAKGGKPLGAATKDAKGRKDDPPAGAALGASRGPDTPAPTATATATASRRDVRKL